MEIPLEQIVGTLNRANDFDDQFRPLKPSLKDRWVNTYLALEKEGWAPILVHKVGDRYFVEDGHHRVSVARHLGMRSLEARIWDYSVPVKSSKEYRAVPCPDLPLTRVCACATD
jgi:hypothetical protein